jgi:DNA helicase IV
VRRRSCNARSHELAPIIRTTPTAEVDAERIKGDARMAAVLRGALDTRFAPPDDDVVIGVHGARVTLGAGEIADEVARVRTKQVGHTEGRGQFRDALLMRIYRGYQRRLRPGSLPLEYEVVAKEARADEHFRALIDDAWAPVGARALVTEILTKPAALARAADAILTDDEQQAIIRTRGKANVWTPADRVLLDEAASLIEGRPQRYGHVVIDEAQDLSPMQLRMLERRASGSVTVLGDLGQATGPWAHREWSEVARYLTDGSAHVDELTLGYRVSPAIMTLAGRVLARSMPRLRAPSSVRAEPGEVHVAPASGPDDAVRLAVALGRRIDFGAVIAPDAELDALRDAFARAGVSVGDAREEEIAGALTLVPAGIAKGLEFDGVLLVEPAAIVAQGGLNLLYICLTRAMRALVIAHRGPLPDALAETA